MLICHCNLITEKEIEQTIRSLLSLACLAPNIVEAAVANRLPRGLGITNLTDLPADWSEQRRQLGLD